MPHEATNNPTPGSSLRTTGADAHATLTGEELSQLLYDACPDAVIVIDEIGTILFANPAVETLFGYATGEVIGRPLTMLQPAHLREAHAAGVRRFVETGERRLDWRAARTAGLHRDGQEFPIEVAFTELGHGHFGGFIRDIRARAESESAREFRDRVMEGSTNAIAAADVHGRFTLVNPRTCELTGYTPAELIGEPCLKFVAQRSRSAFTSQFERVISGGTVSDLELDVARKDGTAVTVRLAMRPLVENGAIVGAVGSAEDITLRKWNDGLLRAQQQLLEMIAEGAPLHGTLDSICEAVEALVPGSLCSILLLDGDGQTLRRGGAPSLPEAYTKEIDGIVIGPNVGSCGSAAYRREPVIVSDIATDPLWEDFRDLALQHNLRSCWSTPIIGKSGSVLGAFAIYRHEPHTPSDSAQRLVGVVTHIAGIAIERRNEEDAVQGRAQELVEVNERLLRAHDALAESRARLEEKSTLLEAALVSERDRARRDTLTGALNHAAIADEVRRLIDAPDTPSLAVAMIDVDGLKAVNDTYGHQMGDAVLLAVAGTLKNRDAIVGRYGGDEFVAILAGADRNVAAAYREDVAKTLADIELRDPDTGSRIQIVASIGVAIYPEEAEAVEDLIKLSDSAMYSARRQRADTTASTAFARIHGGDRAAELVGEIVPFLTSPGDLTQKLNLVAERLSAGAGYVGVNFSLYPETGTTARSASFSESSRNAAQEYDAESLPEDEAGPLRRLLQTTRRPVIIDDVSESEFTTPAQREILATVGIRSGLVAPMIWRGELLGSVAVGSKLLAGFGPRDAQFLSAIATQVTAIVRTAALVDDLQAASSRLLQAHTETVMMLAAAAEAHDDTTGRHLRRVRSMAQALAKEMGHNEDSAKEIGLAAVLHDIGKIRVPDYVLGSTASLSDGEWTLMKDHTIWGGEFLLARGGFELAAQVARSHHERWDGSGYPDRLLGEQIPEAAALTSVADSLDAIISDRPYRPGRPLADAIEEIRAWSGRQFNPHVVDALVRLYERGELPYADDAEPDIELAA